MFENFSALFGLYQEAVFAVRDDEFVYHNPATLKLLPGFKEMRPEDIFSRAILDHTGESFVGEIDVLGRRITYSAARLDGCRVFSIIGGANGDERAVAGAFGALCEEMFNNLALLNMAASVIMPYIDNLGDKRLRDYCAVMYQSYFRILRLTSNIEVLGDAVISDRPMRNTRFDLIRECAEIINTCRLLTEGMDIDLSFSSPVKKLGISADKDRIQQMLLNMISNSLINTKPGDKIILSVTKSAESVLLKVTDTGSGIPEGVVPQIWSGFYGSRNLLYEKRGAGFGLAAVSQIARLHGGSVFFESRENEGTTVVVAMPLEDDAPVTFNQDLVEFKSNLLSSYLTGLATVLPRDKYARKYID